MNKLRYLDEIFFSGSEIHGCLWLNLGGLLKRSPDMHASVVLILNDPLLIGIPEFDDPGRKLEPGTGTQVGH